MQRPMLNLLSTLLLVALFATVGACLGCNSSRWGQQPIQATMDKVFEQVVKPAIEKAIEETTALSMAHQGNLQGIDPGYEITFEGWFSTGIQGKATVHADGMAGTITWNAQSARQDPPKE